MQKQGIIDNLLLDLISSPDSVKEAKILEIAEHFKTLDVSQHEIVHCWSAIKPFITSPIEQAAFEWIKVCLKYRYNDCDLMRLDFYHAIRETDSLYFKVQILNALTHNGRDLRHFEHDIGDLVASIFETSLKSSSEITVFDLIDFMINLVKYSRIYLTNHHLDVMLNGLFKCFGVENVNMQCLVFIDTVSKYAEISSDSLMNCVLMLSAGSMIPESNDLALSIFKNLTVTSATPFLFQSILHVLFQADYSSDVVVGALGLAEELVNRKNDLAGAHLMLAAFVHCGIYENIQVGTKVLKSTLTLYRKAGLCEFDSMVGLFRKTRWIWKASRGKTIERF